MRGRYRLSILLFIFVSLTLQAEAGEQTRLHNDMRSLVTIKASSYLGIAYHFGGEDARGLDCSGFINAIYGDYIPDLPRRSKDLFSIGTPVQSGELQPGDLVFFNTTGQNPSHVGIYIGRNHFIHAASAGNMTGVIISSLSEDYYRTRYSGARRIIQLVES
jgi:cell wall-associated NlpC family hydrolase